MIIELVFRDTVLFLGEKIVQCMSGYLLQVITQHDLLILLYETWKMPSKLKWLMLVQEMSMLNQVGNEHVSL